MRDHVHTIECYARNERGPLAYTPCRVDGLDRNLRNLKEVDFEAGLGLKGLRLICGKGEPLSGTSRAEWDAAVRAWRRMLAQRPLGVHYVFPLVPLSSELTISPRRYSLPAGYPAAFWTMDSIARGA